MKRVLLTLALTGTLAPGAARASNEPWATGHILVGGSWTTIRSTSVLIDHDSIDGFFFPAPPAGTILKAEVTRNGGCPAPGTPACRAHTLSLNFHSAAHVLGVEAGPRVFLHGCGGPSNGPAFCVVPGDASTGEVAAGSGVDLDVRVSVCLDPAC